MFSLRAALLGGPRSITHALRLVVVRLKEVRSRPPDFAFALRVPVATRALQASIRRPRWW